MLGGPEKTVLSGGFTENRTVSLVDGAWCWLTTRNAKAHSNTNASIQAARSRHGLCLTAEDAAPPLPSAIASNWSLTSCALCHRSSGSFSRQVLTTVSSARGNIGRTTEIGAGLRSRIAAITLVVLFPSNAR